MGKGTILNGKDETRLVIEDAIWNNSRTGILVGNSKCLDDGKSKSAANLYYIKPSGTTAKDGAVNVSTKIYKTFSSPHIKGVSSLAEGSDNIECFTGGLEKSIVVYL